MTDGGHGTPELVAGGLGWPEGPTVLPDGSLVFVESYRSQLTVVGADGVPRRLAYVAGAPNSSVLGGDGALYVCQNGGTVGPWRAAEMSVPSIQRVRPGGKAEILLTHVGDIGLNGPNDLVFAADGRLIFTDPGTYNPAAPDPSYIHALHPDGTAVGFIPCGGAPTNCAFSGETLWVTDATVLAASAEPNYAGQLWRLRVPGGGAPAHAGRIDGRARA